MRRAGDVLSALFDDKLMKKVRGYSKLFACWGELAEKSGIAAAADHSRIADLKHGVLLVEADHSGWIQILQTREHRLLDDLRRRFPDLDISAICFILSRTQYPQETADSDLPEEPAAGVLNNAEPGQSAGEPLLPAGATASGYDVIKDEAFKESLKRLEQGIAGQKQEKKTRNRKQ